MNSNYLIMAISAVSPLVVGFIWYNPNLFGKVWLKECGFSESEAKPKLIIYLYTYILSFVLAFFLTSIVIHYSMGPESEFRTFKHGALHGSISGVLFALPIIGISAMFEKKSFKYVLINSGYWIASLAIMGGIICQFS